MKTSLSRQVLLAATVLPLLVSAAAAASTNPKHHSGASDLRHPPLYWRQIEDNGTKTVDPVQTRPGADKILRLVKKNADGTQSMLQLHPLSSETFQGHRTHYAALPEAVRGGTTFVNFLVRATPASKPDDGSIINVDGAIIGFQAVSAQGANGPAIRAKIMVMTAGADGKPVWVPSGMTLPTNWQTGQAAPIRLGVKIDHAHRTWAIYLTDILVRDNLPLFAPRTRARISVRPGILDTDKVELADISVGDHPYIRPAIFLPADANGHVDFAKAEREHDPRLQKAAAN